MLTPGDAICIAGLQVSTYRGDLFLISSEDNSEGKAGYFWLVRSGSTDRRPSNEEAWLLEIHQQPARVLQGFLDADEEGDRPLPVDDTVIV